MIRAGLIALALLLGGATLASAQLKLSIVGGKLAIVGGKLNTITAGGGGGGSTAFALTDGAGTAITDGAGAAITTQ